MHGSVKHPHRERNHRPNGMYRIEISSHAMTEVNAIRATDSLRGLTSAI